jgi:hypothetical protein
LARGTGSGVAFGSGASAVVDSILDEGRSLAGSTVGDGKGRPGPIGVVDGNGGA